MHFRTTRYLQLLFLLLLCRQAAAQRFYRDESAGTSLRNSAAAIKERYVVQDRNALLELQQQLRMSDAVPRHITIPLETGRDMDFIITANHTLSAGTQRQFPHLGTYTGYTADNSAVLRLTLSEMGMTGIVNVKGEDGTFYFEPVNKLQPELLVVYNTRDMHEGQGPKCGVIDNEITDGIGKTFKTTTASGDCELRTYRFAVATTGEYTTWAGSISNAAALIVTTVNNLNERYERDLSVHLTLVLDTANIYADSLADPFTTTTFPTSATLTESSTTLNLNTGSSNYDIGMTFGYGWSGGLAGLGVACGTSKGRAAGGLNSGFSSGSSGPIFDDVIAHEMAHQLNATHTMAANNGGCAGNVTAATSWEPGGGSTIMAYSGTCSGNAYQTNTDHYFHGGTIAQIMSFITTGAGSTCPSKTISGNQSPVVSVSAATYNIPHSTPFRLQAIATDTASDILSYCWEQLDALGTSGTSSPPSATATSGPLFRSYPPVAAAERYFPALSVLRGSALGTYEVLPTVARALNFKVTVRDNHPGAGCTAYENVTVNTQSCGPFAITNYTTASSLTANGTNTMTLTWNTAISCVATATIDVLFSTDGGVSFPYTILSGTANDGTETFIVPNMPTCNGRFMIRANGNIYFNINAGTITISSACLANGTSISPATELNAQPGDAALNLTEAPVYGTAISSPVTGSIAATDKSGNLSYYDANIGSCNGPSNANRYDTLSFYPSASGTYSFTFVSPSAASLVAHIYSNSYEPGSVCTNFLASSASRAVGAPGLSLSNTVSAGLCGGARYVLVISTFNTSAVLPATYSMSITTPAGASIANGSVSPSGLNYCYITVDKSTDRVMAIGSTADLRDSSLYQRGHMYSVYGISSGSNCDTLAAHYTDSTFTALRTAVQEQRGGLCAQLSANQRLVGIGSTSLPLALLDFRAVLAAQDRAVVSWHVAMQADIRNYSVQRSIDGREFTDKVIVAADQRDGYSWTDTPLPLTERVLYYRLKIGLLNGGNTYGPVVPVWLNAAALSLDIHPNPAGQEPLTIVAGGLSADASLIVADLLGRPLMKQQLPLGPATQSLTITTESLPAGMYFVYILSEGQRKVCRFVKK